MQQTEPVYAVHQFGCGLGNYTSGLIAFVFFAECVLDDLDNIFLLIIVILITPESL